MLKKKKWTKNFPIVKTVLEMCHHKRIQDIDLESELILDISLHQLEIQKIFSFLSTQHYVNFHKIKNIPLKYPFFGFKDLGLKLKPSFDNPDYDENKLKIKYNKIKILMNGNVSLFHGNFRFFEKSFDNLSTYWVSFIEGEKNILSESEKDHIRSNKRIPEKIEEKEEPRQSCSKPEVEEKKSYLLQTNNAFSRKPTYMKKNTIRRSSNSRSSY
jgi:hypothetical protein